MRHVSQQASPRTPWTAELKHRRLKPRRFEHTDTDRRVEMEPHGSGTSRPKGHPSVCAFGDVTLFLMGDCQVAGQCQVPSTGPEMTRPND
ncbi:hypothetical protein V500_03288 [Pseudogymnoascus sp. VKM F-4518 (FW-2643)]|nr:hypothetical protein V500_03288 [Pseudogymnoascus sp. VKM F-4518 (FW-2643)]